MQGELNSSQTMWDESKKVFAFAKAPPIYIVMFQNSNAFHKGWSKQSDCGVQNSERTLKIWDFVSNSNLGIIGKLYDFYKTIEHYCVKDIRNIKYCALICLQVGQ